MYRNHRCCRYDAITPLTYPRRLAIPSASRKPANLLQPLYVAIRPLHEADWPQNSGWEVPTCLVNEAMGATELHAGLASASRPPLHDQATAKVMNEAELCPPVQVVRHWAALSLGGSHAAGVSTDAECYTWGCNDLGQLGYSAGENKHVPTKMDILRGWDVKAIACGCVPMIP